MHLLDIYFSSDDPNTTFINDANVYSAVQCFSPLGNDLDITTAEREPANKYFLENTTSNYLNHFLPF